MRKKVLILGHSDATQFIDIFNQYTRLFDSSHYEVTVAYLTGMPTETTRERTLAEHVLFFDIPKQALRTLKLRAINKLLQLCRKETFDIVICHRYKPTYLMLWVARFCRIPVLICVMHEIGTMKHLGRQCLMALLARKNVLLAGVSNAVRDDMRRALWGVPKERIVTLYNVIDVSLTTPQFLPREQARAVLGLPLDTFVFGTIGRLVPNKDQATLIHAFSILKLKYPFIKLVIIGDGELEATLCTQIQSYGLQEDIILTGFLPTGYRYLTAFDVFVLPSTQEAFGRVLLEAMLAKCPVIASRVNGIPEVVNNTGLLIKPRKPLELVTAMEKMYTADAQSRTSMINTAYTHVIENFSLEAFQRDFWQLPLLNAALNH